MSRVTWRHKPYSSTEQQTRHGKSTQQLGWHVCVAWPDKNIDGGSATIADACNSFLLVLLFIVINITATIYSATCSAVRRILFMYSRINNQSINCFPPPRRLRRPPIHPTTTTTTTTTTTIIWSNVQLPLK